MRRQAVACEQRSRRAAPARLPTSATARKIRISSQFMACSFLQWSGANLANFVSKLKQLDCPPAAVPEVIHREMERISYAHPGTRKVFRALRSLPPARRGLRRAVRNLPG